MGDVLERTVRSLEADEGSLRAFVVDRGLRYFGITHAPGGLAYREWAPAALSVSLAGDFNGWDERLHMCKRDARGIWELFLPDVAGRPAVPAGSRYRAVVTFRDASAPGGKRRAHRIPAWTRQTQQDPHTGAFAAVHVDPAAAPFHWRHPRPPSPASLRVYEAHVGISSVAPVVGKWREFQQRVLPRIAHLGYNALQLMAVQEHGCYESFGYHVTSFFAPCSRFGPAEDLKALVDAAHGAGLVVLMDLVHAHSSSNSSEGLSFLDGSDGHYFHKGKRGHHPVWGSRLFDYGKEEVLRFLLANLVHYSVEYGFDGFRFDAVTTMLQPGLCRRVHCHALRHANRHCSNGGEATAGNAGRAGPPPPLRPSPTPLPQRHPAAGHTHGLVLVQLPPARFPLGNADSSGVDTGADTDGHSHSPVDRSACADEATAATAGEIHARVRANAGAEAGSGARGGSLDANIDADAHTYLALANLMLHELHRQVGLSQPSITVAEECSGYSGLCAPPRAGGLGFDYRLSVGLPRLWEEVATCATIGAWPLRRIVCELCKRRAGERTIAYAECHDQSLVGSQTLAFRLMGPDMYAHMSLLQAPTPRVEFGLAALRLLRVLTCALGGEGYLNFMGNEFGHPEWVDFPRKGNGRSLDKARRRWDLADDPTLRYQQLAAFDRALNEAEAQCRWLRSPHARVLRVDEAAQLIVFSRGGLLFAVNAHPSRAVRGYEVAGAGEAPTKLQLNSDDAAWGGRSRPVRFHAGRAPGSLLMSIPPACAVVAWSVQPPSPPGVRDSRPGAAERHLSPTSGRATVASATVAST